MFLLKLLVIIGLLNHFVLSKPKSSKVSITCFSVNLFEFSSKNVPHKAHYHSSLSSNTHGIYLNLFQKEISEKNAAVTSLKEILAIRQKRSAGTRMTGKAASSNKGSGSSDTLDVSPSINGDSFIAHNWSFIAKI